MRVRDTFLLTASCCAVAAASLAPSSGADGSPPTSSPSSADGDVAVTSTNAKVSGRSVTLTVTCASTPDKTAGCSGGRVVLQRSGKAQSSGGRFDSLANGEKVKVKLTMSSSLKSVLKKRKSLKVKTQTLTSDSGEKAGLIREVTLRS